MSNREIARSTQADVPSSDALLREDRATTLSDLKKAKNAERANQKDSRLPVILVGDTNETSDNSFKPQNNENPDAKLEWCEDKRRVV